MTAIHREPENTRVYNRIAVHLPASIMAQGWQADGICTNISPAGCAIIANPEIEIPNLKTAVYIQLQFSALHPITVTGEIVHMGGNGTLTMGIRFFELEQASLRQLHKTYQRM